MAGNRKTGSKSFRTAMATMLCIALMGTAFTSSGCSVVSEGWENVKDLLGFATAEPTGTDQDETDDGTETDTQDETEATDPGDEPSVTTEPPEGDEFVKVSRMLDPLLWEAGEKLYYIDLNTETMRYRYDLPTDDEAPASIVDEVLLENASAIAGFSKERIFCLSPAMYDSEGRVVKDVIAVDYEGSESEVVVYHVENAAVIDDNWLLVSRYSEITPSQTTSEGADKSTSETGEDASESSAQPANEIEFGPLELAVIDLKKAEEHVIFTDDGNIYPGMSQTDEAFGCNFQHEDDGIRVEIMYPGYSEFPYVRYILFADGQIVQDSSVAPWQDNLGQYYFADGMVEVLQEIKVYDDLAIYTSNMGELTSLVYDHPDNRFDIIGESRFYVLDFFYHQNKVLAQIYDRDAGIDEAQMKLLVFNPTDQSLISQPDPYRHLYQYQDTLAGLKIERLSEETKNNIEGRFIVEILDENGKSTEVIFNQVLNTGSVYGDISYDAWRAGHDLVIRYETHEPDIGTVTHTTSQWLFISLAS